MVKLNEDVSKHWDFTKNGTATKNAFVRKNMAENSRWCGVLGCAETIRTRFFYSLFTWKPLILPSGSSRIVGEITGRNHWYFAAEICLKMEVS